MINMIQIGSVENNLKKENSVEGRGWAHPGEEARGENARVMSRRKEGIHWILSREASEKVCQERYGHVGDQK